MGSCLQFNPTETKDLSLGTIRCIYSAYPKEVQIAKQAFPSLKPEHPSRAIVGTQGGIPIECATKKISQEKVYLDPLLTHSLQPSPRISELAGKPVSNLDIMALFVEILKLMIESNHQERIARREEELEEIRYMEKTVGSLKSRGQKLFDDGITSGIFSLAGPALQIISYGSFGTTIHEGLTSYFTSWKGMSKDKFFEQASKMCTSFSEWGRSMGQVDSAYSEADQQRFANISDRKKRGAELSSSNLQNIKREWEGVESFIYHGLLQMESETVRALFSRS